MTQTNGSLIDSARCYMVRTINHTQPDRTMLDTTSHVSHCNALRSNYQSTHTFCICSQHRSYKCFFGHVSPSRKRLIRDFINGLFYQRTGNQKIKERGNFRILNFCLLLGVSHHISETVGFTGPTAVSTFSLKLHER